MFICRSVVEFIISVSKEVKLSEHLNTGTYIYIYTTTFNDFVNMNLDFVLVNWIGEHKRHNEIFHLNENLRQNSQGSYLM